MKKNSLILLAAALLFVIGCSSAPKRPTSTLFDGKYVTHYYRTTINENPVEGESRDVEFLILNGQAEFRLLNQDKKLVKVTAFVNPSGALDVQGNVDKIGMIINAQIYEDGTIKGHYFFEQGKLKVQGEFDGERVSRDTSGAKEINLDNFGFSVPG
ncbi:hypothetical protein WDW89_14235 [Deltaproteobacteria bacterium TL4]